MAPSSDIATQILATAPPLPLTADHWQAVVQTIGFSTRQADIVELILRDLTDQQIALVLGISESTIETHKSRIRFRTGAGSRIRLAMLVLETALQIHTTA